MTVRIYFALSASIVIGARAAAAAVDGANHVRLSAKQNTDERQEFFNQANPRMNRWIDAQSNLVMTKGGLPPQETSEHFQKARFFWDL